MDCPSCASRKKKNTERHKQREQQQQLALMGSELENPPFNCYSHLIDRKSRAVVSTRRIKARARIAPISSVVGGNASIFESPRGIKRLELLCIES